MSFDYYADAGWEFAETIPLIEAIAEVPEALRRWPPYDELPEDELPPAGPPEAKARQAARRADRWKLLNDFIDATVRDLSPAAALTWLVLFRDTKQTGLARTGEADIARRIGRGLRTVQAAVAELKRVGLLTIPRPGGPGKGASVYRLRSTPRIAQ